MVNLEHKIPPPIIMLLTAFLMWFISPDWSSYYLNSNVKYIVMAILFICGISIDITGLLHFRKAQTTINPLSPEKASHLVIDGIYRLTRNPMYLGMVLLLLSWAIYLTNYLAFAFLPLFTVYITQFQIKPEEKILTGIFGNEFINYQQQVRRWI